MFLRFRCVPHASISAPWEVLGDCHLHLPDGQTAESAIPSSKPCTPNTHRSEHPRKVQKVLYVDTVLLTDYLQAMHFVKVFSTCLKNIISCSCVHTTVMIAPSHASLMLEDNAPASRIILAQFCSTAEVDGLHAIQAVAAEIKASAGAAPFFF